MMSLAPAFSISQSLVMLLQRGGRGLYRFADLRNPQQPIFILLVGDRAVPAFYASIRCAKQRFISTPALAAGFFLSFFSGVFMRGDFLFTLTIKAMHLLWLALLLVLCLLLSIITLPFLLVFEGGRALTRLIDRLFRGIA